MTDTQRALRNRLDVLKGELAIVHQALEILTPLLTDGNVSFMTYRNIANPLERQRCDLLRAIDQTAVALVRS